ncbi:hypothetical protein [Acinetobacter venetianus]|uniref:hypothetical protein n=1 Tax=Acinetobacter venetianus TaxID=52133 RepID=UPI001F5240F3|nr:hypothetical protein [Acinetobacter venetianus]
MTVIKVYIIPFHVKRMDISIMPLDIGGAYVSCYVASDNYINAIKLALKKLNSDGLYPEEILQPINEIEVSSWGSISILLGQIISTGFQMVLNLN